MIRPFSDRFIARGKVAHEAPGHPEIKKGDIVYLYFDSSGGGWYQWGPNLSRAYPFADNKECANCGNDCTSPWYYAPSDDSIEVVPVTYYPAQDARIEIKAIKHE